MLKRQQDLRCTKDKFTNANTQTARERERDSGIRRDGERIETHMLNGH